MAKASAPPDVVIDVHRTTFFRIPGALILALLGAEQPLSSVSSIVSLHAFYPCRGVSRDHASRECPCGGPAKLDEHLLVPFCESNVPSGTVWLRAGSPGGTSGEP